MKACNNTPTPVKLDTMLRYMHDRLRDHMWKGGTPIHGAYRKVIGRVSFYTQGSHGKSHHAKAVREGRELPTDTVWAWETIEGKKVALGHHSTSHKKPHITKYGSGRKVILPADIANAIIKHMESK